MAPEKATEMVLNVDLKCSGCYKKVKKIICKMPQIRDQIFDVDKNKVKIIVVCCSPEKIRDKLCYKGGGAIQSIEIVEKTDKPKPVDGPAKPGPGPVGKPDGPAKPGPVGKPDGPAKPGPVGKPDDPAKPKPTDKPKEGDKPKPGDKPKDAGKPKAPENAKPADKPKDAGKPQQPDKPKPKEGDKPPQPKEAAPKKADGGPGPIMVPGPGPAGPGPIPDVAKMVFEPVQGYPQMYPPSAYPMVGYGQYYDQGYGGAPFQHGYGMTVAPPPPPSYTGFGYENGYNGHGYENGYNGHRGYHTSNDYVDEENSEGCSIM